MTARTERSRRLERTQAAVASVLANRASLIGLVFLLSILAGLSAGTIRFQSSIESWFLEGDPELAVYREFLDRFEADENAVIAVFAKDVFTPNVLALIGRITRAAQVVPFAGRVRSLAEVETFFDRSGDFVIAQLMDEVPATRADAERIRRQALDSPLIRGVYVAADARAAAIVVELETGVDSDAEKAELVAGLREIIEAENVRGLRIMMAGALPFSEAFQRYAARDATTFGVAAILVVFGLTFLHFRNLWTAAIPLVVVMLSLLWTGGFMGAGGFEVTILSVCLVSLILTVGVADSIHVLTVYRQRMQRGLDRERAIAESVAELLWPCFLTSATTAAGLLSLSASTLEPVREFGWMAAVGVSIAFLLSMTVIPVLLSVIPAAWTQGPGRERDGWVSRLLVWLGRPTKRRAGFILAGSLVMVVTAAFSLSDIPIGSNPLGYFDKDAPIRLATEAIDGSLGGSVSLEFLVDAPSGGLREPELLQGLAAFQQSLGERVGISTVTSIVDTLKEVRRVFEGRPPGSGELPETAELAAQLHLLIEGAEDYPKLVQEDASIGRISARASYRYAPELVSMLPEIERELQTRFGDSPLEVRPTGQVKLIANMEKHLVSSQLRSFLMAFGVISAMMFVISGSIRLGALAMIPNLVPILVGLAIVKVFGFQLDPGTVMIGSIALGLVVDDTVHFIVRLERELSGAENLSDAIERTMEEAGRPIILTSIVLSGGFLVMVLSSFGPNIHFGATAALVTMLALVADLVILPAALLVLRPRI